MYWEPVLYLALLSEAVAAALAIRRGMREGYDKQLESSPIYRVGFVLVLMSFIFAMRFDVMVTIPSLMLLASSLAVLAGTRLRARMSPVEVLGSAIAFYSFALASLAARGAVLDIDPRGRGLLLWILVALSAGLGLLSALSTLEKPRRGIAALMGLLSGVGLVALGYWLLMETRVGTPLYSDALGSALLALLLAGAAIASGLSLYLVMAAGILAVLFASRSLLAGGVPYIVCTGNCGSLAMSWLIFSVIVALPRLYLEAAERRDRIRSAGVNVALSPPVLASASVLAAGVAAWVAAQGTVGIAPMAVAGILAAAAAVGSAAVAVLLVGGAVAVYSPVLGLIAAAAVALVCTVLRGRNLGFFSAPRSVLPGLLLVAVGLAAGGYIVATLGHVSEAKASIEVSGLGPLASIQPPSDEATHAFFQLYLGVKNETILYAILEPTVGKEEALRMVEFAHAIRVVAEKRGIQDPYNITELDIPREMPGLKAVLDVNGMHIPVEIPASSVLYGHPFNTRVIRAGLDLVSVGLPGNATSALTSAYLGMISNPGLVDGDALRYSLFAAMAVSWRETGSLNMTAQLIFDMLLGNVSGSGTVVAGVDIARAPLGVLALAVYGACIVAAPLAPIFARRS